MAVIVFYDSTELDREQLSAGLASTDHHWEFVEEKITPTNLNPEAEIISVFTMSNVTREIIDALPKLTLIACRSTGFNNIDLEAAEERGITVVNVPAYGDSTVAEYSFTLLLALVHKLPQVLEIENEAFDHPELTGRDLYGKTIGVIGTGRIGQKSLQIARGFSMKALAYDVAPREELAAELGFTYVSLEELLAQADVVTLHTPYMPETHHLMNRQRLESMKPGAILVNTARGGLVDTKALVDLLQKRHLGGAALDVLEGEQLLDYYEESALLSGSNISEAMLRHSLEISVLKKMPNVIVSPHNAYNTIEAIGRINGTTTENIIGFYQGSIPNQVAYTKRPMGKLILVRHTESIWNACGVWSGLTDIPLSEKGKQDCRPVAEKLRDLNLQIDTAIYTEQSRTRETLEGILAALDLEDVELVREAGFNERNYGVYTGMDKWKVKEELGEERFEQIRRGWDVAFPNGETLKDVYNRVVPAYQSIVLPRLRDGKNVLLVAHGNSLRALKKYLDSIPDEAIAEVEMLMSQIVVYDVDPRTGLKRSMQVHDNGAVQTAKY